MVVFRSIIVFDSETTSLPQLDCNTTRIVELAFLGFEIKHLKSSGELPRALHKLVLLFNPSKLINPEATKKSGLDNEILENLNPFGKEDANLLKSFVLRLPPPVCIVAHNGEKFDFPILRRMLDGLQTVFGNNVYCADSAKAFREIYPKTPTKSPVKRHCTEDEWNLTQAEKTPFDQKTISMNSLHYENQKLGAKRELFPDQELENHTCNPSASSHSSSPKTYRLKDMYTFLQGKNFKDAHRAESDSLALLTCISKCNEFLNWINSHSAIFDNVAPLF